jgi:hypothetical protein
MAMNQLQGFGTATFDFLFQDKKIQSMQRILFFIAVAGLITINFSCMAQTSQKKDPPPANQQPFSLSSQFKNLWSDGKAELTTYHLKQARYGQIHNGYAVTIFVTEDFSKQKEVKLDDWKIAGDDRLPVLKLNLIKKFNTGIYSYSLMESVFSPMDLNQYPHAVKVTASLQDWCGMLFSQLNQRLGKNTIQVNSYFESEGDQHASYDTCLLEDELWNLVRMGPRQLPTGNHKVLPGQLYCRFTLKGAEGPLDANLSLSKKGDTMLYKIEYPKEKHTLVIHFLNIFPYRITGWEETFPGFDGKLSTTVATIDKTMRIDYWNHHFNPDLPLRDSLGLTEDY